jgi:hypothetical protein
MLGRAHTAPRPSQDSGKGDHVRSSTNRHGATFRTERVLPYPPQQVFEAFARPELLARWWGPSGFTNTFEVFEFKPGGRWKFVMHGPDGSRHPEREHLSQAGCTVDAGHSTRFATTLRPHRGADSRRTWNDDQLGSGVRGQRDRRPHQAHRRAGERTKPRPA